MKAKFLIPGLLAVAVVSVGALQIGQAQPSANLAIETPLAQWEYKVIIPNEEGPDKHEQRRISLEVQLQQAGAEGWELVEMPYLKGVRYQVMVMKRPK